MKLFHLCALLAAFLLLPGEALPQARPPAQKTGPITIYGSGSTGDVSAMSVTNAAGTVTLSAMLDSLGVLPSLAPKANPVFTGTVTAPVLALTGAGSTGDVSGMSVTNGGTTSTLSSILGTVLGNVSTIGTLAPKANPTFTGTVTAPKLVITGTGTTGDLSAASVTPSGSAPAGTLAALLYAPDYAGVVTSKGALVSGALVQAALGGLNPVVGSGVNLTGNPFDNQIAPPPGIIGPSTNALAGFYSNVTSNNGYIAGNRTNNSARYRAGILAQITAYANSPDIFGMDIQVNHGQQSSTDISVIGLEVDMAKDGSRDCATIGGPVYCAGFLMTSSTDGASSFGPAFLVEGVQNSFHYGYTLTGNGVKDAGFFDNSSAASSVQISGNHVTGIFFSGTITGQQVAGLNWSVDKNGGIVGAAMTSPIMVSTSRTQIASGAPTSNTQTCAQGEIKINSDGYIYFCTTANSWRRVAGTTF